MDSKEIEALLEKYWSAETSLEEEQVLYNYFNGPDVPESMKSTKVLFNYLKTERSKSLSENFETAVTKELRKRQGGKVISLSVTNLARIAAGLAVVVAATFFIRQEVRKAYPEELKDTYSDPELAFEETKKALMMISNGFGKARQEAGRMKVFNEAEKKIQSKDSLNRVNI